MLSILEDSTDTLKNLECCFETVAHEPFKIKGSENPITQNKEADRSIKKIVEMGIIYFVKKIPGGGEGGGQLIEPVCS